MKIYLKILVFVFVVSCQQDKKEGISLGDAIAEKNASQYRDSDSYKGLQLKTTLTEAEFNDFFPKQIDGYDLINVSVSKPNALGSALYVKNNDYAHSMTYSLEDGNKKNSAVLRNFEDAFAMEGKGPVGTEYIYKVREGYKTIAFLQPNIKRNDIRFVYDNRFRISLEGTADVQRLWSYIQKEDLQKLDNY